MLDKIKAVGEYIFVIKDDPTKEMAGIDLPSISKIKPNTGRILTVGSLVQDKSIKPEKTAVFNSGAGFQIDIFETTLTVLNQGQILGVL